MRVSCYCWKYKKIFHTSTFNWRLDGNQLSDYFNQSTPLIVNDDSKNTT